MSFDMPSNHRIYISFDLKINIIIQNMLIQEIQKKKKNHRHFNHRHFILQTAVFFDNVDAMRTNILSVDDLHVRRF